MMRIGTRISADWIDRPNDLQFLKQIGVDYVDIVLDMVPGYKDSARIECPSALGCRSNEFTHSDRLSRSTK